MSTPLLATKLYRPLPQPDRVHRQHLIAQLNDGLQRNLTLIAAAAGFGKTTLLSQWLADCARPVAWLTLDDGDSEPVHFLAYLIAAVQTAAHGRLDRRVTPGRVVAAGPAGYRRFSAILLLPLDNERRWYRYHHLFGELLHQRLLQIRDESAVAAHR